MPTAMVDLQLVSLVEDPSTGGARRQPWCLIRGARREDCPSGIALVVFSITPQSPAYRLRWPGTFACRNLRGPYERQGMPDADGWRAWQTPGGLPVGASTGQPPTGPICGGEAACLGTQLSPGESIQAPKGRLTSPGALVIGPTAYFGVALVDQGRLGPVLPRPHDATPLRKLFLHIGLGRCRSGFCPRDADRPRGLSQIGVAPPDSDGWCNPRKSTPGCSPSPGVAAEAFC